MGAFRSLRRTASEARQRVTAGLERILVRGLGFVVLPFVDVLGVRLRDSDRRFRQPHTQPVLNVLRR